MEEAQSVPNEEIVHEIPIENAFSSSFDEFLHFVSTYGWFLLFGALLIYFIWQKLKPHWYKWQDDRDNARYHKDPDVALVRMEAMETARRRLQERHDADAASHLEKMKQKEEERKNERIKEWERHEKGLGYHGRTKAKKEDEATSSGSLKTNSAKPRLRNNDYNPLMGFGGSSGYRPSSRFGSSGGGGGGGGGRGA